MSRFSAATHPARPQKPERVAYRALVWVAPLAAIGAVIGNVILYGLGRVTGIISDAVLIRATQQPLAVSAVISTSLVGVLGATSVYTLLGFTRRPITLFRLVAVIVLIGSVTTPFSLTGASDAYRLLLLVMHVVVAAFVVVLLTTRARREPDDEANEEG